jgi:nucleotide-binding universal stress UspA family protein
MFDEVIACLDGSSLAETILPLARALTAPQGGTLTLLRVVADPAELAAEEDYLRDCARQYSGQLRFIVGADPADAIGAELERIPQAIAALTTHGRSAWSEAIVGSVALRVIRAARRPVVLFRPLGGAGDAPKRISKIVVALDGSHFAERMIPYAVKAAQALAAQLSLVQALPAPQRDAQLTGIQSGDIHEASYLHGRAADIKKKYAMSAQWEVLHGEAAAAICDYVKGMSESMLALTTHARAGVERAMFGSVAADCVRHAGVPLLLYWPEEK